MAGFFETLGDVSGSLFTKIGNATGSIVDRIGQHASYRLDDKIGRVVNPRATVATPGQARAVEKMPPQNAAAGFAFTAPVIAAIGGLGLILVFLIIRR